jgi:hypothetical protein
MWRSLSSRIASPPALTACFAYTIATNAVAAAIALLTAPTGAVQSQATVTLSAVADLDVRSSWLEFHEFEALTNGARVDDVGVGMLDGLEQTLTRRDVLIVGDVWLSGASPSPIVRVTDVLLPPHPPRSGQLALEMLP